MNEPGLAFDGVGMTYADRAVLTNVNLRLDRGERVAVLGPSGAGKTTLLRIGAGMLEPAEGSCRVFGALRDGGRSASRTASGPERRAADRSRRRPAPADAMAPARRADVAFVPQDHALVGNLRVVQNVLLGGLSRQSALAGWWTMLRPGRRYAEVHAILDRLGIGDTLFQRTDRLSGGQQQRVAIARAVFQRPRILLLDEPVASIDPVRAASVLQLVTELAEERDITLCFSLHDVSLARRFCPRLLGLRAGHVQFDRAAGDVAAADMDALYATDAA